MLSCDGVDGPILVIHGSLVPGVDNFGAQCVGRLMILLCRYVAYPSNLFGEIYYAGDSHLKAAGVGAAGSCGVLFLGTAGTRGHSCISYVS